MSFLRRLVPLLFVVGALFGIAACGQDGEQESGTKVRPDGDYAAILDVRTAEEFAEGHVDGARNLPLAGPEFQRSIEELPKSGTYLVYCRSGNRSAQAAEKMRAVGLDVIDAGGLSDMREAGFPFVE